MSGDRILNEGPLTWRAEEGGQVLGWISVARSRDEDALPTTGEVWAIYVDPPHWRRGVGQRLKANAQAIAFYEAHGLVIEPGSEKTITLERQSMSGA